MPTASVVVGTLADPERAQHLLADLLQTGFGGQQLGLARATGELIVQDAALVRADVAGQGLARVLVGTGVPVGAARRYQRAFAAARTIVTVQTPDRSTEAASMLRAHRAAGVGQW